MAIIVKNVERPRELKWYKAGAMLYGDWGTSKAYVLGIAFALAGHASWFYLGLMAAFTALIGFCYTIICRVYPDGGGVYSSLRNRSRIFAVIGALMLIADYVVTASLSALSAFQYFNVSHPEIWAIGAILMIGAINWIGPGKSGSIATLIALMASVAAGVLLLFTLPHLHDLSLQLPKQSFSKGWSVFTGMVLALSGVEAVANMTGIMVRPVGRTSKFAIWPVLIEVSLLTFLLGVAMNAIPGLTNHIEDMLRALGAYYVSAWYGEFISIVFALLLLSAVNTAVNSLVSMQFLMAKDSELPNIFSKLNFHGMPWLSLIVAVFVPSIVLFFVHDLVSLAALYAIGVVGAITINLGACALNQRIALKTWERSLLYASSATLLLIEITIALQKTHALIFASSVVVAGLLLRKMAKSVVPVKVSAVVTTAEILTVEDAKAISFLYQSSFLLAMRTLNYHLMDETALLVKARGERAVYFCVIEPMPPLSELPEVLEPSSEFLQFLSEVDQEMERRGVMVIPVWQIGHNPGELIADVAKKLEVKTVIMGTTKRGALINLLRGNVLHALHNNLHKDCHLVIIG